MNYEESLLNLLQSDDRLIIMTAENRAAMRNLPSKITDRFIDVGIAEQTMVGMAAGLALRGRIPLVHALATFLTMRAYEFIRTDIGIANLPVKLFGSVAGFLSEANGPTHQALEDISLMRGIPGMNIFAPADEEDLLISLPRIVESNNPSYIRFINTPPALEHSREFEIGKAEIISEGKDVTILTYGLLLREALKASQILKAEGKSVGLINMRSLKPVDKEAVLNAGRSSFALITLEDHFLTGGLYSIISEILVSEQMMCKVIPLGMNEKWFKPALLNDVLEFEGFSAKAIAGKINVELIKANYQNIQTFF